MEGDSFPELADWTAHLEHAAHQGAGRRALRFILPCAGFDAPTRALRKMRIPHEIVGIWETDPTAARVLRHLHRHAGGDAPQGRALSCRRRCPAEAGGEVKGRLHLGPHGGDVLQASLKSLPDADGLISGPPCPPWSSQGGRAACKDARAAVFRRVIQWIVHLAGRASPLRVFILENVRGILHRPRGSCKPHIAAMLRGLRGLPSGWVVEVLTMNSECCAQSRPRVYICGWQSGQDRKASLRFVPQKVTLPFPRASLRSLLGVLPNTAPRALCEHMQHNLRAWMEKLQPELVDSRNRGMVGCFQVDRNPRKTWATYRVDDKAPCLRAREHKMWVVSLGEGPQPRISRLLHPLERCLLQGIGPRDLPQGLSGAAISRGCGNAMTVPVVGFASARVLSQHEQRCEAPVAAC